MRAWVGLLLTATAAWAQEKPAVPALTHEDAPLVAEMVWPEAALSLRVALLDSETGTMVCHSLHDGCPVLVVNGSRGWFHDALNGEVVLLEGIQGKLYFGLAAGQVKQGFDVEARQPKEPVLGVDLDFASMLPGLAEQQRFGELVVGSSRRGTVVLAEGRTRFIVVAPDREWLKFSMQYGEDAATKAQIELPDFDKPPAGLTWVRKKPDTKVLRRFGVAFQIVSGIADASVRPYAEQTVGRKLDWKAIADTHDRMSTRLKELYGTGRNWGGYGRARAALQAGKTGDAVEHYKDAAKQGNVHAAYELGLYHRDRARDRREAVRWFSAAAEGEHGQAQLALAAAYAREDMHAEAARWFRRAARHRIAEAEAGVGRGYYKGQGVAKDHVKALHWYKRAALRGDAPSQYWYGFMRMRGQGGTRDVATGVTWVRKAAKNRVGRAMGVLATHFVKSDNLVEAYAWAVLALENGEKRIGKVREMIEGKLTDEQKKTAATRIANLRHELPKKKS